MSELGAYVCGVSSLLFLSLAFLPILFRFLHHHETANSHLHPNDDPTTMARKLQRRCHHLDEARHRIRSRAAELRGLKWEMEHFRTSTTLAPYTGAPTLGHVIYRQRIAKLDREIYRLRACDKLIRKMRDTAGLILEMLTVEAHVHEIMPQLGHEPTLLMEQVERYRKLEAAFDECSAAGDD